MLISQLAYVGASTTDLSAWRGYGTEVLGLEVAPDSDDGLLYLRTDERHHRLGIHAGDHDDVSYVGWEVADHSTLEAAAASIERRGVTVHSGKPTELADRRVLELVYFDCPYTGVRMEIVVGHEHVFTPRFKPTRDLAGFRTAELGMGHVVLYTADVQVAAEFYRDSLGFGISDYGVIPGVGPLAAFLHCNPRHHSLAFIANDKAPRKIQHVMFETRTLDDVGLSYDLCLEREITATSLGRHNNDRTFSFYFRNPSQWMFEYGFEPRTIDPDNWTTEHYLLKPGNSWGHAGLMNMV
ncbi:VOC family protein [Nocardia sp. CA-290969]|uniref:VOC family protein n=1 Tax=Nocardia sp. CA-290969 TaxID=3239986 RepID=UPI003D944B29